MYLERKIDRFLVEWKNKESKNPALIVGIRQCGKTESIKHFAGAMYKNYVIMNFWNNPEYCDDFNGELNVDTLISNISLRFPNKIIEPHNTLIVFDEIQECPRARLSFKNFSTDGRYDVIGSGSYLGINGYLIGDATPVPTGYEDVFKMNTMDFEEFIWANGIDKAKVTELEKYFNDRKPIPDTYNSVFKDLFLKYVCVGGFPNAVKTFIMNKNIMESIRIVQNIIFDIKGDFGRRKNKDGIPIFNPSEVARIQNAFDLIPTFLAKENKRFIVSKIQGGKSFEKSDAIEYLKQANIVSKVHNLENVSLPLLGNKIESQFKLFPNDIGIVSSMYGIDMIIAINKGDLGQASGALYEAIVFDSLNKAGFDTFYFAKESGLEIDMVICYDASSYLVEVKRKNGNTKSAKTIMKNADHYGKTKLLKIGDYNISEEGDIITIPHYLTFILGKNRQIF